MCRKAIRIVGIVLANITVTQAYTIHNNTVIEIPLANYYLQTRVGSPVDSVLNENRKLGASIGINASYFCPAESAYKYCGANNATSSDRIVAGTPYAKYRDDTGERGILGVTKDNQAIFVQNNKYQGYMGNTNKDKITDIRYGIGNFPILLDKGIDVTEEYSHLIDTKMNTTSQKAFICSNESGNTIYMGFVKIDYLYKLPEYLRDTYGCYFAISLDAGRSSALVVNDKHIVGPGRKVTDGFVAIPKSEYIEQQIQQQTLTNSQKKAIEVLEQSFINTAQKKGSDYLDAAIQTIQQREQSKRFYPLADKRAFLRQLIKQLQKHQTP